MNKFELLKNILARGKTPEQIVRSMAGNNPILNNLINMQEKGDTAGVENFVRNFLKEHGADYDKDKETMARILNIKL